MVYPVEQGECTNLSSLCSWLAGIPAQRSLWHSYYFDRSPLNAWHQVCLAMFQRMKNIPSWISPCSCGSYPAGSSSNMVKHFSGGVRIHTRTHARTRARACGVVCVRVYDRARVVWCGVVWCGVVWCVCVCMIAHAFSWMHDCTET